jgi:arsenate reductase
MAEAILNSAGRGVFRAHSAGSHPSGQVHPLALETLRRNRVPFHGAHSKGWHEFTGPGAPPLDFVFTVCDRAAREECPSWPGQPLVAQWAIPDPSESGGTEEEREAAFQAAFIQLQTRVNLFVDLPFAVLERRSLGEKLHAIGRGPLSQRDWR